MSRRLLALVAGLVLATSGCGIDWDPCDDLVATEREKTAVLEGFEVERGDCELGSDGVFYLDD